MLPNVVSNERSVFSTLALTHIKDRGVSTKALKEIINKAQKELTKIALKAKTCDERSNSTAYAVLDHGEEFHDTACRLADITENDRKESSYLRHQMMLALPMADFERRPACVLHEHTCIVEAVESGNQELIDWCMQYHLIIPSMRWHTDKYAVLEQVCKSTAHLP